MKKITLSILIFSLLIPVVLATNSVSAQTYRARYSQAKQQYQREVNFYKSARQDFIKAQAKYQKFKNAANQEELEEATREFLDRMISSMIKRLESIKTWVENRPNLNTEEKNNIIAEINEDITWLQNKQNSLANMDLAAMKELAREVKDYWKRHRAKVKRITGHIYSARIDFVIDKSEGFATRVQEKIDELGAAGHDTGELETWLNDFEAKIALAKEKYEAAKTAYQGISPDSALSDADTLLRQAHAFVKEAHQYIKEAHAILKQIIREMKDMNNS